MIPSLRTPTSAAADSSAVLSPGPRAGSGRPARFAWLLAVGAPLAASLALLLARSVWVVFLAYQIGFCLLLPLLHSLVFCRIGWRGHARLLGLRPLAERAPERAFGRSSRRKADRSPNRHAERAAGPASRRAVVADVVACAAIAIAAAAVVALFLAATSGVSDPADRVREAMVRWGIAPATWPWVLAFMLVVHAPAEEFFWRGYLYGRLVFVTRGSSCDPAPRTGSPKAVAARVALLALLYASYHAVTLTSLVPSRGLALVMFGGVWAAGGLFSWLRWRFDSIWPPLVAHGGAVAAYLVFVPSL